MDDIDRRLIQDKQDQLLTVAKKAMEQQREIDRLRQALGRIVAYQTPEQLRQNPGSAYGLSYEEALEMAYENILAEAVAALSQESA